MAAHDEERYIGRCLRSLLAQRFPRDQFEVVVVDDGSTDRTPAILETFASE
ncbi:MAG: glycosyltransferase, partial [Actinomycetota bacterium]